MFLIGEHCNSYFRFLFTFLTDDPSLKKQITPMMHEIIYTDNFFIGTRTSVPDNVPLTNRSFSLVVSYKRVKSY